MATYLLDSDIIIDTLNGKRGRDRVLRRLVVDGGLLACCAINITEVYTGVRPGADSQTDAMFERLLYYPITREIARRAGVLRGHWLRRGVTLGLGDALLAAVAIENDLTLITGNRRHFPMPEIRLYPLQDS